MEKNRNERRSAERVKVLAYVSTDTSQVPEIFYVDNITPQGAYLVSRDPPPLQKILKVRLAVRFMPDDLEIEACVIRHGIRGFAVVFQNISEFAGNMLRKHLYGSNKDQILGRFRRYRVKLR